MRHILSYFLLVCLAFFPATTNSQTPPAVVLDGTAEVIFTGAQRASRGSAVKVEGMEGGHGSGTYFTMSNHHLIITARHVVDRNEIFYISTTSDEKVIGQVIWKSQTRDIAILKIPQLMSSNPVTLHKTTDLNVGEEVTYTGYPASYELLTTKANVSGYSQHHNATLLQGFVWFGYSGSGAFDSSGRLRAIVVAIGAEDYHGVPQLLETLVYIHEIRRQDIAEIKKALEN
jgi:S1-C subfamily serine protease